MIRMQRGFKSLLLISILSLTVLGLSGPAHAAWYWVHGHSGHVQFPSAVTFAVPEGEGLWVKMQNNSTPVHFAVPTLGDTTQGARLIRVRFNINIAKTSCVESVTVYNGETIVKTFHPNWCSAGWQTRTLDLGTIRSFTKGLGVSIELYTGPDSPNDSFILSGVGANFVAK